MIFGMLDLMLRFHLVTDVLHTTNRSIDDYEAQFANNDIKHVPQISEYELNPHLLSDPKFKQRAEFEREHGIVPKCLFSPVSPLQPFHGPNSLALRSTFSSLH